jgi:nucleotide-binding universal stress UspA family protein
MPIAAVSTAKAVQVKSVLVATDFSQASEKPLRHAVDIARLFGAKFYLMHVVSSLGFTMTGPDCVAAATELSWRDARELERDLVESGALNGLRHEVLVRDGEIWIELERVVQQEHIDLVVIGTHSRGGLGKLVLGSVAEQIFRHASCLVLTVGPHSPARAQLEPVCTRRPLLFATDFSEGSLRALPYALSFANLRETSLVLLHVLAPVPQLDSARWYTASDVMQARESVHDVTIARLRKLVCDVSLEHEPVFMAPFGEPAEGILCAAERVHAEAIILGLNPGTHADAMSHLPWSNAYKIVCGAGCPVLTVRS